MPFPGPAQALGAAGAPGIYAAGSLLNNGRYRVNKRLNSECLVHSIPMQSLPWPQGQTLFRARARLHAPPEN